MLGHVFISYAREDRDTALRLRAELMAIGITTWIDVVDLLPGQDWQYEIRKALQAATHVLILLSTASVSKKGYVQREVRDALDLLNQFPPGKVFIIPIRLDDSETSHEALQRIHRVDLFVDYEHGVSQIAKSIMSSIERGVERANSTPSESKSARSVSRPEVERPKVPSAIYGLERLVQARERLPEPLHACEDYRDSVDLLVEIGRWAYKIAVACPPELLTATEKFTSRLKSFARELRAAVEDIDRRQRENARQYGLLGMAGLLPEVRAALVTAAPSVEGLLDLRRPIQRGVSLEDLRRTKEYQRAANDLNAIEEAIHSEQRKQDQTVELLTYYGRNTE